MPAANSPLFCASPALGRVGAMPDAETFAVQLEKAIARSGIGEVIDITPNKETS